MADIAVLEFGSATFRAGFGVPFPSEDEPRVQTPSVVEFRPTALANGSTTDGKPARQVHPIQRGEICHMDGLEALIHYALYELLGWEMGHEGSVVLAEPIMTPRRNRELVAQLLFEVFNAEAVYAQDAASLSLAAMGKLSGTVVDIGHGKVDVASVVEGQVDATCMRQLAFGGQDLTHLMGLLLERAGISQAHTPADLRAVKEACARAAASRAEYQAAAQDPDAQPATSFTLPDGQEIRLTTQGLQVAEAILDPSSLQGAGLGDHPDFAAYAAGPSVAEVTADTIVDTYVHMQQDPLAKKHGFGREVLMCGGGALIPELRQRLLREVREASRPCDPLPEACPIPGYMPMEHTLRHAAWMGAVVISKSLAAMGPNGALNFWVLKADYDEAGPTAIWRKFS